MYKEVEVYTLNKAIQMVATDYIDFRTMDYTSVLPLGNGEWLVPIGSNVKVDRVPVSHICKYIDDTRIDKYIVLEPKLREWLDVTFTEKLREEVTELHWKVKYKASVINGYKLKLERLNSYPWYKRMWKAFKGI